MERDELIKLAKQASRLEIDETLQSVSLQIDFSGADATNLREWLYSQNFRNVEGFQIAFSLNPAQPQQKKMDKKNT